MAKRLLLIVIVVAVLASLIVYSQMRPESQHVSGFVEADEIRLGSRVGGRVQSVLVEEGSQVKAGQLLVELEPFNLKQLRDEAAATLVAREAECRRMEAGPRSEERGEAKARYEQLQARLDMLVAGPRPQEIDAARARLQVAKAALKLATENYRRIQELAGTKAVTREHIDRSTEALDAAAGQVAQRTEELKLLEAGTREEDIREARAMTDGARLAWEMAEAGYREEDIQKAEAARDAARAALEAIDRRIDELSITSPVAGMVESMDLRPGDLVPAGVPVLSVMDKRRYWIRAYVPQKWMNLHIGQRVWVTSTCYPGEQFPAEITFISREAEFIPSNVQTPKDRAKEVFRIKAMLIEGKEKLWPGTSADVWLTREDAQE